MTPPPGPSLTALLQQKANTLALFDGLEGKPLTDTIGVYNEVFQVGAHAGMRACWAMRPCENLLRGMPIGPCSRVTVFIAVC